MSDWPSPTGKRHRDRAGRRRAAAMLVVGSAMLVPVRGDPADDPSAVVMIGRLHPEGALDAAGVEVPRHWRLEAVAVQLLRE